MTKPLDHAVRALDRLRNDTVAVDGLLLELTFGRDLMHSRWLDQSVTQTLVHRRNAGHAYLNVDFAPARTLVYTEILRSDDEEHAAAKGAACIQRVLLESGVLERLTWPPCIAHPHHPMWPGHAGGVACWSCPEAIDAARVPIGRLPASDVRLADPRSQLLPTRVSGRVRWWNAQEGLGAIETEATDILLLRSALSVTSREVELSEGTQLVADWTWSGHARVARHIASVRSKDKPAEGQHS